MVERQVLAWRMASSFEAGGLEGERDEVMNRG